MQTTIIKHTFDFNTTQGDKSAIVKVAAVNALARCTRYVDSQFVSTDIKGIMDRVQSTSQADASSTSLPYMLDLVRIAGQGASAVGSMPMGTPYYRRSQAMVDETDKGWWNANGKVQLKRPQMG